MIKIDKIEDGLPISVIIPLTKSRRKFFNDFVLPMIEINNPMEIIINDDDGYAPKKRNDGFKKSSQPYVFFCDDDIIMPNEYLFKLYAALDKEKLRSDKIIGYTYTGYKGIVLHPETHPMKGNFEIPTVPFSIERLKKGNYISTMSLISRDVFCGFDESLKRLQDYDLWLTLASKGIQGKEVNDTQFFAYYLDNGITNNLNNEFDAMKRLRDKHNL